VRADAGIYTGMIRVLETEVDVSGADSSHVHVASIVRASEAAALKSGLAALKKLL
jgi:hypothetical protein